MKQAQNLMETASIDAMPALRAGHPHRNIFKRHAENTKAKALLHGLQLGPCLSGGLGALADPHKQDFAAAGGCIIIIVIIIV